METILVSLITTIGVIVTSLIQNNSKKEITRLENIINENSIETLKNFIVRTLSDVEQGKKIDEITKMKLYESYDKYTNIFHKNSYIHDRMEKVKKDGLL